MGRKTESLDAKPWLQTELEEWVSEPDVSEIETMPLDAGDRRELVRSLMLLCIPSPQHGRWRRWRVGYVRFVVLAWMHAPELFGAETEAELAATLGISRMAFHKHKVALEGRGMGKPRR